MEYRKRIFERYLSFHNPEVVPQYEKELNNQYSRLKDWLPEDKNSPILEIACGRGHVLYLLEHLGYTNVTGVDISGEQIELARKYCRSSRIYHQDIIKFLEKDNTDCYDLVIGFDIIEHLTREEAFHIVPLLSQNLNKRGRVVLQTPNAESPFFTSIAYGDLTHEWFYTPRSLKELFALFNYGGYEARPLPPFVHGLKSAIRRCLWIFVNMIIKLCNMIETGSKGSGINTRVFIAKMELLDE